MTSIYLVRHGRTSANAKGILAGRTKGISLDEVGLEQAEIVAQKLKNIYFKKIIVSPMERCQQTAKIIAKHLNVGVKPLIHSGINECDYGNWSNKKLLSLRKKPLWKVIQDRPSQVEFPDGEKMVDMLNRFKSTITEVIKGLKADDNVLIVSHGDPIRSFIADCLGIHLDNFQRIIIDPCSISLVKISDSNCQVVSVNNRVEIKEKKKTKVKKGSDLGGGAG